MVIHNSTRFHENRFMTFHVIISALRQKDKQTNKATGRRRRLYITCLARVTRLSVEKLKHANSHALQQWELCKTTN